MNSYDTLVDIAKNAGAQNASVIEASNIGLEASFRDLCAANTCGKYGTCWMCPPDCGDIYVLMDKIKSYNKALIYQTIGKLEDSFDIEGMGRAAKNHSRVTVEIRKQTAGLPLKNMLHLGAGACQICERCTRPDNLPCKYPDLAISSLEAHGINVSGLAEISGMKYVNGANTVTYFGALFFTEN